VSRKACETSRRERSDGRLNGGREVVESGDEEAKNSQKLGRNGCEKKHLLFSLDICPCGPRLDSPAQPRLRRPFLILMIYYDIGNSQKSSVHKQLFWGTANGTAVLLWQYPAQEGKVKASYIYIISNTS
jgi:hypothetical protein